MAHGRRVHLDHRNVRPAAQPHVLGHRQCGPVDRRPAPRRQPLLGVGAGPGRRLRQAARVPPVPLERLVGLGRGLGADSDGRQARGPDDQGPRAPGAERISLAARAARRRHRLRGRQALRQADRLQEHRSAHRAPDLRREQEARHRQEGGLLPVSVGRQGLGAGGLQPEDRIPLHPREREPVRLPPGCRAEVRARQDLARLRDQGHRPGRHGTARDTSARSRRGT